MVSQLPQPQPQLNPPLGQAQSARGQAAPRLEAPKTTIEYSESDGKPIADNTQQFRWIVVIKENIEAIYAEDPAVFVAGDLLWYPVEGRNDICTAPDTLVVFGRPKGDRGSYQQWKENNIVPQVAFEILSPSNSRIEMGRKLLFYNRYGIEEYYVYDPARYAFEAWHRGETGLEPQDAEPLISPRLGIRFDRSPTGELEIFRPDGSPFESFQQLQARANQAEAKAATAEARAAALAEKLRELGFDPEQLS